MAYRYNSECIQIVLTIFLCNSQIFAIDTKHYVNNIDLFVLLKVNLNTFSDSAKFCDHLIQELGLQLNEQNTVSFSKFCQKYTSSIKRRWSDANYTYANFVKNNEKWLESPIVWPSFFATDGEQSNVIDIKPSENKENLLPSIYEASTSFTPKKPFEDLSSRQKRRRIQTLSDSLSPEELTKTTIKTLKDNGNEDLSRILDQLFKHPEYIHRVESSLNEKQTFSAEKALGLLVSLKLSKWQYMSLRESVNELNFGLFPSYFKVREAKLDCYPSKEHITVTEEGAQIKLQALLDLTVSRLISANNLKLDTKANIKLVSKWGYDGASGQSNYKQRADFDDSSVFMISLVPIRLLSDDVIMWENDRPSSTFYCRPIMFRFMKETKESSEKERKEVETQIEVLRPTKVGEFSVNHELLLTMIDGKISSYISDTSSASCDICKAKPSEMNNLNAIYRKPVDKDMYKYGLSSLHAWIRCMECLLHIAYRLDFKQWTARKENKAMLETRKKQIQESFRNECNLQIDIPKQGAGTTNDGNTARIFFRDFQTTARITGINEDLIKRFYIILQTMSSGERVDVSKFSDFCRETAILFVKLYPWYNIPASVHKILIHGADIIDHFGLIPIGKLSEEASEARNKEFRNYREHHSRKVSRYASNEDILHNLLLSSDPKLTMLRPRMAKLKKMTLFPEAQNLLLTTQDIFEPDFIDTSNISDISDIE